MMPAGTYYIGDLCYVMNDVWDEFCDLTTDQYRCIDGEFILKDGRRFATYSTMYGDGVYTASNGSRLGVDAGLIGCIRISDIHDRACDPIASGTVVEFTESFNTGSRAGVLHFGDIVIDTADNESDEYDE